MRELPPDLARLDDDQLAVEAEVRDQRLAPLFRRWPRLRRSELTELRRLYAERVRLARYIGRADPRNSRRV